MAIKNLFSFTAGKEPDSLVPAKISFRTYFEQPRSPEIWYYLYDLCHAKGMRPQALIRYLIISAHYEMSQQSEKSPKGD